MTSPPRNTDVVVISHKLAVAMSFVTSIITSALVLAGIYYGFKYDIQRNTERSKENVQRLNTWEGRLREIEKATSLMAADISRMQDDTADIRQMWKFYIQKTYDKSPWNPNNKVD